ncbi:MAG: ABC transporter permease, partial [Bacteroidales bacterium]|nr:ABC transporter permease [Bacteroidales bacterium]
MRDVFLFALDSYSANRRRVLLTVAMIAVGVASLVGIETAVGVLTDKVVGSFDKMGTGLFTIRPKTDAPPVGGRQARAFADAFTSAGAVSCWCVRCQAVVASSAGKATDPVVQLIAADAGYLACEGLSLEEGRNFSPYEVGHSAKVVLIGDNVRRRLFGSSSAVGQELSAGGERYRVIGVLARQGALFGTGIDSGIICPISPDEDSCTLTVRTGAAGSGAALAEAGRLMAALRRLPPGGEADFEIVQADSAQATLASLRKKLSLVALVIGLITMLGAAVGLMNSMLVAVKERT